MTLETFITTLKQDRANRTGPGLYASDLVFKLLDAYEAQVKEPADCSRTPGAAAGIKAAGLRYRFERDLPWHVVGYEDELPARSAFPDMEVEELVPRFALAGPVEAGAADYADWLAGHEPPETGFVKAPAHLAGPAGWKLVPVEPTEAILDAYWRQAGESKEMRPRTHFSARRYWSEMLAVVPTHPPSGEMREATERARAVLMNADPETGGLISTKLLQMMIDAALRTGGDNESTKPAEPLQVLELSELLADTAKPKVLVEDLADLKKVVEAKIAEINAEFAKHGL